VTASQIADSTYDPAPNVAPTSAISPLSLHDALPIFGDKTFGDPDFSVSATASSNLAVRFSASGSCTVNGSTVHLTGAGSCTITGTQAGNENYNPAADISRTFTIAQHVVANAGGPYSG